MMQFIDTGTYYKVIFGVWSPRRGKMIPTGPGIYFPSWDKANEYLQARVITRHPDAYIVEVTI